MVEEKAKAKARLETMDGVNLTSDMWISINKEPYLVVTCHLCMMIHDWLWSFWAFGSVSISSGSHCGQHSSCNQDSSG